MTITHRTITAAEGRALSCLGTIKGLHRAGEELRWTAKTYHCERLLIAACRTHRAARRAFRALQPLRRLLPSLRSETYRTPDGREYRSAHHAAMFQAVGRAGIVLENLGISRKEMRELMRSVWATIRRLDRLPDPSWLYPPGEPCLERDTLVGRALDAIADRRLAIVQSLLSSPRPNMDTAEAIIWESLQAIRLLSTGLPSYLTGRPTAQELEADKPLILDAREAPEHASAGPKGNPSAPTPGQAEDTVPVPAGPDGCIVLRLPRRVAERLTPADREILRIVTPDRPLRPSEIRSETISKQTGVAYEARTIRFRCTVLHRWGILRRCDDRSGRYVLVTVTSQ